MARGGQTYYYRARYYSHQLGRFLSEDPLGFDAGDYNLYRYVFNNPTNATDPTGEVAWFLPWLLKASAEAAVDALMQGMINYYFDPSITTVQGAIESIDMRQVGIAFISGLLPGGRAFRSGVAAAGDVLLNYLDALSRCQTYTPAQALRDFAISLGVEYIGDFVGDWVAKWGTQAVSAGLRKLGFDELAEKLLRNGDEVVDDVVDDVLDDVGYYLSKLPNGGSYVPVRNGKVSAETLLNLQAATNNTEEFALLIVNGEMVILRGGGLNYGLPSGTTEVLAHTHPPGRYVPSWHDTASLNQLGQESSVILTTNVDGELNIIQYTKSGDSYHIPPPLDLFN